MCIRKDEVATASSVRLSRSCCQSRQVLGDLFGWGTVVRRGSASTWGRQQPSAMLATVDKARATQTRKLHKPVGTCRHGPDVIKTPPFRRAKLTSDNSGRALLLSQIKSRNNEDLTTSVEPGSMSVWCLATLQMWLHRPSENLKPIQATRVHRWDLASRKTLVRGPLCARKKWHVMQAAPSKTRQLSHGSSHGTRHRAASLAHRVVVVRAK